MLRFKGARLGGAREERHMAWVTEKIFPARLARAAVRSKMAPRNVKVIA